MGMSGVQGHGVNPFLEITYSEANRTYTKDGAPATEEEINAALEEIGGIRAADGVFETADGFEIGDDYNGAATEYGAGNGMPLPDVPGENLSPIELANKMGGIGEITIATLMFAALFEMARQSSRDNFDATIRRSAMQEQKDKAKEASLDAQLIQIAEDREAARDQLVTGCCVAVGVAALQIFGALAGGAGGGLGAVANVAAAVAAPLGAFINSLQDYISKESGAQRAADNAAELQKRWEYFEAVLDSDIDDAKTMQEQAQEQFKLALQLILETLDRQTQVSQIITQ